MNKAVLAAITAAINAYIEQEGQAKAGPSKAAPYIEIRSLRPFGRQEILGARARSQVRGYNREGTGFKPMGKEIQV
jgi:hypothetical protein